MNWEKKEIKRLLEAFLVVDGPNETKHFLRDLMTEGEIVEFSKRLQAAEMLSRKVQYNAIQEKTGLSSTTVARVSKWLKGKDGGYRTILKRLKSGTPSAI